MSINLISHYKELFSIHHSLFKVIEEVKFSDDGGTEGSDSIIAMVNRREFGDKPRRPLRRIRESILTQYKPWFYDKLRDGELFNEEDENENNTSSSDVNHQQLLLELMADFHDDQLKSLKRVNRQRGEEVVALLTIDNLSNILKIITPSVQLFEITQFMAKSRFEMSVKISEELMGVWKNGIDEGTGRQFHFNSISYSSQLTDPSPPQTFNSDEIDLESFVKVAMDYEILTLSRLRPLLRIHPSKLWRDIDSYVRQLEEGTIHFNERGEVEPLMNGEENEERVEEDNEERRSNLISNKQENNEMFVEERKRIGEEDI